MAAGDRFTILVTGANGFVGRRLCAQLVCDGHRVRVAVRDPARAAGLEGEVVAIGALESADWSQAVAGVDAVIHLAARVHVMHESAADPLAAFRAANVAATENLAHAAAAHGVRRLVYVSSIKVNGEHTGATPFAADDAPAPQDPYGISKHEAERALDAIASTTGLEVVVVRPPLVYGPGVAGNFVRLLKLTQRAIPLPFGAIDNRRSMVHNGNLASALALCAVHPAAAGQTYLVSDGEDLSTAAMIRRLAAALGVKARLVAVPASLLHLAGMLAGKAAEIERLVGSLQVDDGPIRAQLGWRPPYTVEAGLAETAAWFRARGA